MSELTGTTPFDVADYLDNEAEIDAYLHEAALSGGDMRRALEVAERAFSRIMAKRDGQGT